MCQRSIYWSIQNSKQAWGRSDSYSAVFVACTHDDDDDEEEEDDNDDGDSFGRQWFPATITDSLARMDTYQERFDLLIHVVPSEAQYMQV